MEIYKKFLLLVGLFLSQCLIFTCEAKQVTDQLNRTVQIPDKVERVVVLQHQTLNLIVQLNRQQTLVGVLSSWQKLLGKDFVRFAPTLSNLPTPGDLTSVNIESLLALKPQVVFVTNYMPKAVIDQIEKLNIPVIAISLRKDITSQADKINPIMVDEEKTYNEGLKQAIRLIGDVLDANNEAEDLINYSFEHRKIVTDRLQRIAPEKRIRVYMANPDLTTYGSGKYTGLMMEHAGAINVAAATIQGFKQVSIENVIQWNPQVIFVQDRYPQVVQTILSDDLWKNIDAVKQNKVYLMPEYAKAWGYPMPEALAIGELWMAKKLYPDLFKDIDMQKQAYDYYWRFYRVNYHGE
ncbi:ABC transporter substrate-binding protein [Gilliamella sp. B2838]|uniref:ABC transporter substrate-binding protein n=1 Tax=Gilliamella sp. B2838 TaxID=2818020 RepID=UPI002B4076FA|nr:ABC transporter substrate-binding protein [Gilliamella sp. B2838]MCX8727740.1 ABC transporter substrate-binding protein [Gilliamella sp. B2838]